MNSESRPGSRSWSSASWRGGRSASPSSPFLLGAEEWDARIVTMAADGRPLAIEDGAHAGEDGSHALQDGRRASGGNWWGTPPSSGNRAFDDYRTETLQRLEDEQREFKEFLERLRFAKDRAEFDQFMNERRNRPPRRSFRSRSRRADSSPRSASVALGAVHLAEVGGPRFCGRALRRTAPLTAH